MLDNVFHKAIWGSLNSVCMFAWCPLGTLLSSHSPKHTRLIGNTKLAMIMFDIVLWTVLNEFSELSFMGVHGTLSVYLEIQKLSLCV